MQLEHTLNALKQPIGLPVDNWSARQQPSREPMQGRFCRLVATDVTAHAAGLYQAFARDTEQGNWTYLPYGPFTEQAAFSDWLGQASATADPLFHTVLDSDDKPVGLATYLRIEPVPGVIEVGHIHFSPLMQRTPVATETMYLMMQRVFDELAYRRYEWKCDALNGPSRAAAERLGFVYEGTFRQATMYKGRNRDTAWFSITDQEWPQLKAMFQSWLSPQNFDQQGAQLRSLKKCRDLLLA